MKMLRRVDRKRIFHWTTWTNLINRLSLNSQRDSLSGDQIVNAKNLHPFEKSSRRLYNFSRGSFSIFGNILLGVTAFFIAALSIGLLLNRFPINSGILLAEKENYLQSQQFEISLLAVGSSYTYRAFIPEIIDAGLDQSGITSSSYSFAAPGTYAFEIHHYLVEYLRNQKVDVLPIVLLELFPVTPDYVVLVMQKNKFSDRAVAYHDLHTTWINSLVLGKTEKPLKIRATGIFDHFLHFSYRLGNVSALSGVSLNSTRPKYDKMIRDFRGYFPELRGNRSHDKDFDQAEYYATFVRYSQLHDAEISPDPESTERFFRGYERNFLGDLGVEEVIYIIPPVPYSSVLQYQELCKEFADPCFFFNDPHAYPELFEFENRYNNGHLNHHGAEIFSRYLVKNIQTYLSSKRRIPRVD